MNRNLMHAETFYATNFEAFCQTVDESNITFSIDTCGP